ncbi:MULTISPECIES: SDR family oxidoreductase [unclassified Undibacterium]|uniref:SDR family oxidoreductase n=1 Tax=unclassified Undibacterium TaxID=2630295 RepID=UPI002AC8B0AA|nr:MULTISPECIES: SDR family oxidoreductase [unclassified Undibacterium]MEB0137411.1 SDR family oxidoreductase [Undibacterium sp. CCC2.1]MEB0170924.1 SDR family oxidoreductase [Undibacterium sp. CCC1.1]MEB0174876.1 SDR family oxidoreductase [Undibacterium sp. CCC3.4]MEB0214212.1 SDR family oxidoreductase [Undibacterium sp. 5I2]WPX44523.1 SDR family oxidoreductase [Undibacterium sp. CCC3.4]
MTQFIAGDRRVALVTGAARRIGRHIALTLAAQGWDIIVHFGQSAGAAAQVVAELEALGARACALGADLADETATRALFERAHQVWGRIDCIVNNAALFEEDRADSFSHACLDRHMHANLAAPLLLAQALYAATPVGQQACVINLLDQKLYNLNPDFLSYTLSKAALQCATTVLAQALAPRVRVVGVAPGITMVSGHQSEADFEHAHQVTPLGRSSSPDDIAQTVCFIAACPAITGTTIVVDGGQHLIALQRDVMFLATAPDSPLTSH